jgi:hypothetical protein
MCEVDKLVEDPANIDAIEIDTVTDLLLWHVCKRLEHLIELTDPDHETPMFEPVLSRNGDKE